MHSCSIPAHILGPQAMRLGDTLRWCWHSHWALTVLVNARQGPGPSLTMIFHPLLRASPLLFPLPGTFFPTHHHPSDCFTGDALPSFTTSPPATGDPSIVRDVLLLCRPPTVVPMKAGN